MNDLVWHTLAEMKARGLEGFEPHDFLKLQLGDFYLLFISNFANVRFPVALSNLNRITQNP